MTLRCVLKKPGSQNSGARRNNGQSNANAKRGRPPNETGPRSCKSPPLHPPPVLQGRHQLGRPWGLLARLLRERRQGSREVRPVGGLEAPPSAERTDQPEPLQQMLTRVQGSRRARPDEIAQPRSVLAPRRRGLNERQPNAGSARKRKKSVPRPPAQNVSGGLGKTVGSARPPSGGGDSRRRAPPIFRRHT